MHNERLDQSNAIVSRVLVDNGLGVNVLFKDVAEKMGILDSIDKGRTTLHTFNKAPVRFLGTLKLMVQVEAYNHLVTFYVMDCSTPYDVILD
ncbi:hypothetical protein D8674_037654 [Pyrus ussuriensis x Pyrus communis]|uniref:Uncharacterized protein n=1 Tax=Pyrus ussuriensis x Pyrus communis TaxID=2448454 RepID=A0A5N5GZL8_9ROSA|nr:hypothetical protein D8674_037654 [Pyrus ussuriensis x Pyrus communis]